MFKEERVGMGGGREVVGQQSILSVMTKLELICLALRFKISSQSFF